MSKKFINQNVFLKITIKQAKEDFKELKNVKNKKQIV